MQYAIILLGLLLALAPLWHFLPSKRQRHQARLREAAALSGLFVEFRDLPLPAEKLQRLPASERQVLYYGYRLPASRKASRKRQAWYREGGEWSSVPPRQTPPALTAELPSVVRAISLSEASLGLFWQEEGDENLVRDMANLLKQWAAVVSPG